LREIKAVEYSYGLGLMIVWLGLYSYYVRELLASLALFTGAFFLVALAALGVFLIWWTCKKVATWTPTVSRNMIALSRRLIAAYAKP
jgi:hypothetical protein